MSYSVQGGCVEIQYLVVGFLDNNIYIIHDNEATFVVDPSGDPQAIMQALGKRSLDAIVLTHHHYDHIGAAHALRDATGATVIASALDAPFIEDQALVKRDNRKTKACPVDHAVAEGDIVKIGSMAWRVLATPGHTKGSICLYITPECGLYSEKNPVLISGDTLFQGTIGRTDFEGGSMEDMRASLKKLAMLPDETIVLPGHSSLTTIRAERQRVFALYAE